MIYNRSYLNIKICFFKTQKKKVSKYNKYIDMPQLVPFFFVNQVVFAFVILTVLIYAFTKFILPKFVRIFISRIYINKL
jgi:F-type H+-transporting ATPase subunit 8